MVSINENELNNGVDELFDKMISVLRQRGFYAEDNKDCDPCHFLTEQEQNIYKSALDFNNSIPF